MATRLFLHLPEEWPTDETPLAFDWYLAAADGHKVGEGHSTLDDIDQLLQQNALAEIRVIGLVPATDILCLEAKIPGKNARAIQQALPYAIEEQLSEDVEDLHLILGRATTKAEHYAAYAVSRNVMARAMDVLGAWHHKLSGLYADSACLPHTTGDWTAVMTKRWFWLRDASHRFYRFRPESAVVVLESLFGSGDAVETHSLKLFTGADDDTPSPMILAQCQQVSGLTIETEPLAVSPLEMMARGFLAHTALDINLCRGDFQIQSGGPSPLSRWKPVMWVAASWFVLTVGVNIGQGMYFEHHASNADVQVMQAYKQAFPADKRTHIGNIRRVLDSRLQEASNGNNGGFLDLIRLAAPQYRSLPERDKLNLLSLNYSQQRGELVVDVSAAGFPQMEQFKSAMSNVGLEVKVGSATQEKDSVKGRISITGGGRGS